jgi:hypothetical protein
MLEWGQVPTRGLDLAKRTQNRTNGAETESHGPRTTRLRSHVRSMLSWGGGDCARCARMSRLVPVPPGPCERLRMTLKL